MTEEKKRLYTISLVCTITMTPVWSLGLYAFGSTQFLKQYLVFSIFSGFLAIILLLLKKDYLFWYFNICLLSYIPSMIVGMALNTGALLILAFNEYASPSWLMAGTLLFYLVYCYFPIKYYYNDYHRNEKARLKSFDFDKGTYDITHPSLIRSDAFSDYFFKSFLSKAYTGIVRFHLLFPISGGAIAIIAGKVSKNFQLGIGLAAIFLSTITFIQFGIPGIFSAWQVYRLEKRYGKKIMIDWGEDE
ncbi:MAG TPA: hypothetical protein VKY57_16345 [Chitinispirillaceae bacterium]|nr:hypothetical protein [Chitinispirillaceae bacterium]